MEPSEEPMNRYVWWPERLTAQRHVEVCRLSHAVKLLEKPNHAHTIAAFPDPDGRVLGPGDDVALIAGRPVPVGNQPASLYPSCSHTVVLKFGG